jgi:sterol desaturase/sphingolipid hydroxylase (fatty acid hydroxylase superfamily)
MTGSVLAALAVGALSWTLLEYVIHRWLGHDRRFRGNPFGIEHVRHHREGDYFAPTWKKVLVAFPFAAIAAVPALLVAGLVTGSAYVVGLMGFYATYELLHRREHTHPGLGAYGRWARRHHFTHHFTDARCNHGVTTPLWDFVFRTYRAPGTITVPARLCMEWLKDPRTGDVRADWADTFVMANARAPGANATTT